MNMLPILTTSLDFYTFFSLGEKGLICVEWIYRPWFYTYAQRAPTKLRERGEELLFEFMALEAMILQHGGLANTSIRCFRVSFP